MSLWKGKRAQDPNLDLSQVEVLLKKAITLNPGLAEAHLQLANLLLRPAKICGVRPGISAGRELNPDLADVHYRLAQAYVRVGEKDLAQQNSRCTSSSGRSIFPISTDSERKSANLFTPRSRARGQSRIVLRVFGIRKGKAGSARSSSLCSCDFPHVSGKGP